MQRARERRRAHRRELVAPRDELAQRAVPDGEALAHRERELESIAAEQRARLAELPALKEAAGRAKDWERCYKLQSEERTLVVNEMIRLSGEPIFAKTALSVRKTVDHKGASIMCSGCAQRRNRGFSEVGPGLGS